ncbi:MAG: OB-fold nucleic acid binding domain-containing protein, partial [Pirellula sp.]
MHTYRTHNCNQLTIANVGETVRLSGWVFRVRDHGKLMFIDLRDHYGVTQIVVDKDSEAFQLVQGLNLESVIRVDGKVLARSGDQVNANLPTGHVEVRAVLVELLSPA